MQLRGRRVIRRWFGLLLCLIGEHVYRHPWIDGAHPRFGRDVDVWECETCGHRLPEEREP